jgi:hypothetical protein
MAAGDIYTQGIERIEGGGTFSMKPSLGTEVVIHNVCHTGDCTLEFFDEGAGLSIQNIDKQLGNGAWMGMFLHCTHSKYYRVVDNSGKDNFMSCDGVVTK